MRRISSRLDTVQPAAASSASKVSKKSSPTGSSPRSSRCQAPSGALAATWRLIEPGGMPRFYTIFFDWDKSDINPVAERVITAIINDWGAASDSLQLIGHADRSGPDDYNQRLSERRVASVTSALAGRGFRESRLSGYGVGETDPAVPTPDGVREPRNRRVVVTLP